MVATCYWSRVPSRHTAVPLHVEQTRREPTDACLVGSVPQTMRAWSVTIALSLPICECLASIVPTQLVMHQIQSAKIRFQVRVNHEQLPKNHEQLLVQTSWFAVVYFHHSRLTTRMLVVENLPLLECLTTSTILPWRRSTDKLVTYGLATELCCIASSGVEVMPWHLYLLLW